MARHHTYGDGPDGSSRISLGLTALPCPGVALRLNTVIDCTPTEERTPPVTIEFLVKNLPPHQSEGVPCAAAAPVAGRFTCNSGDFVLVRQLRLVGGMVAAMGLPPECTPSVEEFIRESVSDVANSFYKAIVVTVEAGSPTSILVDEYEDENEEVPAGAAVAECPICYKDFVVGGATSVALPCNHMFHRKCLNRWTLRKPTCPCCRAPVPERHERRKKRSRSPVLVHN